MNTQRNFKITSGPNRDMLFDACKYAYDKEAKIPIQFVVTRFTLATDDNGKKNVIPKLVENVRLTGIKHERSSDGETFIIQGYCKCDIYPLEPVYRTYRFQARYNTKMREGTLTLE